jgi:hypothetical protein
MLVGIAVVGGAAFDIGIRGGLHNGFVALAVVATVVSVLTFGRLETRGARSMAVVAIAPACALVWRASPWLAASNSIASVVLLTGAVSYAHSGSLFDTNGGAWVRRTLAAAGRATTQHALLRSAMPNISDVSGRRAARVARAGLVALPMLVVVVALLASADAVFAGLVKPDVHFGPSFGHVVLFAFGGLAVLTAAEAALGDGDDGVHAGRFDPLELVTMLALAAGVLGVFVVSQLIALTGSGRRLVETSGLTPAEYARSGFFQLCWATALLVAFLALIRFLAAPGAMEHRLVRVLGALVPTLALGLVVVSLRRMALYDKAFGFTMLRLWVVGAAVWMGLLLGMIALRNAGVGGTRNWVFGASGACALVLVVGANLVNPEAFIVEHNITRADAGASLDVAYLQRLSDDAVPAVARAMDHAVPARREELRAALRCGDDATGAASVNVAARAAATARHSHCADARSPGSEVPRERPSS